MVNVLAFGVGHTLSGVRLALEKVAMVGGFCIFVHCGGASHIIVAQSIDCYGNSTVAACVHHSCAHTARHTMCRTCIS